MFPSKVTGVSMFKMDIAVIALFSACTLPLQSERTKRSLTIYNALSSVVLQNLAVAHVLARRDSKESFEPVGEMALIHISGRKRSRSNGLAMI